VVWELNGEVKSPVQQAKKAIIIAKKGLTVLDKNFVRKKAFFILSNKIK